MDPMEAQAAQAAQVPGSVSVEVFSRFFLLHGMDTKSEDKKLIRFFQNSC